MQPQIAKSVPLRTFFACIYGVDENVAGYIYTDVDQDVFETAILFCRDEDLMKGTEDNFNMLLSRSQHALVPLRR